MPLGVEARLQRLLNEVVTVSQGIRTSAYAHANSQNFNVFEKFRRQLETIRISADAVLEAVTKASLTNYTIDDRMIDWLISGELGLCVSMLKEVEDMLKLDSCARNSLGSALSRRPTEDKLVAAMAFFDKHQSAFHFLITSNVWNCEKAAHRAEVPESNPQPAQTSGALNTAYEQPLYQDSSQTSTDARKKDSLRKKLNEVLQWLAALNCTATHNQMLQLRQEATCKWFPNTDAYKMWRTGGRQFLWLHGLAGCGKSVLTASAIEHLKKTLRHEEPLVYFYCDFRNERSTSSTEVIRSLLSQMLCYYRDHGVDPGILPNKMLEGKKDGTLLLDDLDKLRALVSHLARTFRYEPIIVIDALDECVDMVSLLDALLELSQGDVRLLVTSRPHPTVSRQFTGLQMLSFEEVAKEVAADIELHVRREVESHGWLRSTSVETKNEIHAKLSEKANGRFRWVQCQLDILKRCESEWELKETLDDLPTELGATYEKILETIDERKWEGELTRRALAWLVVALQPLCLTQLLEGLSVELEQPTINRKASWPAPAILQALSSLVSYNEETDILALSHFTVKEYLTNHTALPKYRIVPHVAHAEVARMCMHYVSVFLTQKPFCGKVAPLKSFPVLSYVLSFGFNHMAHVNSGSMTTLETLESLGLDILHHPSHWDHLCQLRENDLQLVDPLWPSSRHDFVLYMLIAYSSIGLFNLFLAWHRPLKPRVGTNPLVYAADMQKTEHASALIACGADVNARGLIVDDSYKPSLAPLELAIDRGADVLVGELLKRGCVVTSELLTMTVYMPWCDTRILVRLVYTDQFLKWANDIGDKMLCCSLFNSARPNAGDGDYLALARRLSHVGQQLSPDNPLVAKLIERAVYAAHTSMLEYLLPLDQPPHPRFLLAASTGSTSETVPLVRFLLSKGVDIDAVSDGRHDTALHLAATCSWEPRSLELTKMLVEAGCSPRARNLRAETPLTVAVTSGYVTVADYLFLSNALLPSDILPIALWRKAAPRMIDFLICRGAEMRSTYNGDSILHLAITHYPEPERLDMLRNFIKAGCDLAMRNSNGKTVLETAIEHKCTAVVEFLLSNSAPLPPDILLTALRQCLTLQIIETLVHSGADVHSTTSNGDTVLHLAIALYPEEECLMLVSYFVAIGCNLTTHNHEGNTVLEVSIQRNYILVVDRLLSYSIVLPPDVLSTLLMRRVPVQVRMVEFLTCRGVDVQATTPDRDTLLHLVITNAAEIWDSSAESKCRVLVRSFIEAGCDPTVRNSSQETAMDAAIKCGYDSVAKILFCYNVPFSPDISSTILSSQYLRQYGTDVCSTTSGGDTPLHLLVSTGIDDIRLISDIVKASYLNVRNSKRKTALEIAIERGMRFAADCLIGRGADVYSATSDGSTLLHLAITSCSSDVRCSPLVEKLLEAGCDPTAKNPQYQTVLEVAVERNYPLVVENLLSRDATFPPELLLTALRRSCDYFIIESLITKYDRDRPTFMVEWGTAIEIAYAHYFEWDRLWVIEILEVARVNSEGTLARDAKGRKLG